MNIHRLLGSLFFRLYPVSTALGVWLNSRRSNCLEIQLRLRTWDKAVILSFPSLFPLCEQFPLPHNLPAEWLKSLAMTDWGRKFEWSASILSTMQLRNHVFLHVFISRIFHFSSFTVFPLQSVIPKARMGQWILFWQNAHINFFFKSRGISSYLNQANQCSFLYAVVGIQRI